MISDDANEWGPWVEHDGRGIPSEIVGKLIAVVAVTYGTGEQIEATSVINPWQTDWDGYRAWDWSFFGKKSLIYKWRYSKIVRYRVRKPRALRHLIELAESVPAEMEFA